MSREYPYTKGESNSQVKVNGHIIDGAAVTFKQDGKTGIELFGNVIGGNSDFLWSLLLNENNRYSIRVQIIDLNKKEVIHAEVVMTNIYHSYGRSVADCECLPRTDKFGNQVGVKCSVSSL